MTDTMEVVGKKGDEVEHAIKPENVAPTTDTSTFIQYPLNLLDVMLINRFSIGNWP